MKVCAITMVYRDYWALSQWYAHYSRHLGAECLYIVAHGHDPKIRQLCPQASIITVPRDDLTSFDRMRGAILNDLQSTLSHVYDWIIRTDADELVCLNPARYGSFHDMLAKQTVSAVFALGMNVVELESDPLLDGNESALGKRPNVVLSGHYSKAWAVRDGVEMMRHGVKVDPAKVADFVYARPRGVYLAHLKYANREALAKANVDRMQIASAAEKGGPGKAWLIANKEASDYLKQTQSKPVVHWKRAVATAERTLEKPVRQASKGIVRTQSLRFPFRTVLPNWFATY